MFEQEARTLMKTISFIVSHALNNQQFKMLLDEVNSQYCRLLKHNNVRWLSCSNVLHHFVECSSEIRICGSQEAQLLSTKQPKMVDSLDVLC
jgi:hypothetical protein